MSSQRFVSAIPSSSPSSLAPSVLAEGGSFFPPMFAVGCVWAQKESILYARGCAAFEEGRRNVRGMLKAFFNSQITDNSYCLCFFTERLSFWVKVI